jgi:hypothetical protein
MGVLNGIGISTKPPIDAIFRYAFAISNTDDEKF